MTKRDTIYKRTSAGAIQIWYMEIEGSKYRTISGQIDGLKVTSNWTEASPTNVGKANARNAEEQAIFEVDAMYKQKLSIDYWENMYDIDKKKIFEPMLANDYNNFKKKMKFSSNEKWFIQPKIDGHRCIVNKDGMWSRTGKPIVNCPHIFEELKFAFAIDPDRVFDGELYNHDYHDDFNTLTSFIRKTKIDLEAQEKAKEIIQYHIYDFPCEKSFEERYEILKTLIPSNNPHLKILSTYEVVSKEKIDDYLEKFLEVGYEGAIIRNGLTPYENKRTNNLLKYKNFIDQEFVLLDLVEGLGNWSGVAKVGEFQLEDGRTFKATLKGTREYCLEVLKTKEQYLGKKATVKFFNWTPDGIPRFGVIKELARDI